jgi:hypothetical protein
VRTPAGSIASTYTEVLPMPPDDIADWPDRRFERET